MGILKVGLNVVFRFGYFIVLVWMVIFRCWSVIGVCVGVLLLWKLVKLV